MRFPVDAQLPPALARLLQQHGQAAEHVVDIGPGDASDSELWRHALAHGAVLVTKDADFLCLGSDGNCDVNSPEIDVKQRPSPNRFEPK